MTTTTPRTYSPAFVGKRLRVTKRTVQKWCDSGRLPHRKTPKGVYKITPEGLAAFLAEYGFTDAWERAEAEGR